jgi:DNA-directed RNA polymerase specialized sigma24 family protein
VVADDRLWPMLRAATASADAWPALMVALEPELAQLARWQPIGRLRDREDSVREIVTRVFARLHARDLAAIHALCACEPAPPLRAWLRVIVRRAAIDFMREHPEYRRATEREPAAWVSLATLASTTPAAGPSSLAGKRHEVIASIREMVARARAAAQTGDDDAFGALALAWRIGRIHVRRLATKGERLEAVLAGIVEGRQQDEIAKALGVTRREVELCVRYLEEVLHARFAAV